MNTKISFTYRDAANYKIQNSCVLAGEINSNMIAMILDACEDGERFIPEAVGLPHATFEDIGYSYHDDLDHPWFELGKYNFELTFDPPSVDLTLPRLVANFVVHKNHWEDDVDEDTVNTDLYDKLFEGISDLLSENDPNLDGSDKYAEGYHDALLDVLELRGMAPETQTHFD